MNPQVFPQTLAAVVEGFRLPTPASIANRQSEGAASKIRNESRNKKGAGVPVERQSALLMQWMVSVDANGSRRLRVQWEAGESCNPNS